MKLKTWQEPQLVSACSSLLPGSAITDSLPLQLRKDGSSLVPRLPGQTAGNAPSVRWAARPPPGSPLRQRPMCEHEDTQGALKEPGERILRSRQWR